MRVMSLRLNPGTLLYYVRNSFCHYQRSGWVDVLDRFEKLEHVVEYELSATGIESIRDPLVY